uniref:Uncharacterized protein n=1 Tax=Ditylenchus dipsaci TaxID=166011 RepID=A0A915DAR4_9BILA
MKKLLLPQLFSASLVTCNEIIPRTFENFDFGMHSKSVHQLIAAGAVIALISILIVAAVVYFDATPCIAETTEMFAVSSSQWKVIRKPKRSLTTREVLFAPCPMTLSTVSTLCSMMLLLMSDQTKICVLLLQFPVHTLQRKNEENETSNKGISVSWSSSQISTAINRNKNRESEKDKKQEEMADSPAFHRQSRNAIRSPRERTRQLLHFQSIIALLKLASCFIGAA